MTRLTKFYFGSSTSDASNTGIDCVFDVMGKRNICYRNLTDLEKNTHKI